MDNYLITYSPRRSSTPPPSSALATYHSSNSSRRSRSPYYSTYYPSSSSTSSTYYHISGNLPSHPRHYDDSDIIRIPHRSSESRARRERERERERERRRHSLEIKNFDSMIEYMKACNERKQWELNHLPPAPIAHLPPSLAPAPAPVPTISILPPPPPPAPAPVPTISYGIPAAMPVNITYGAIAPGTGRTTEVPAWNYYGMSREIWERYWTWSTIANQWYHEHADGRIEWLKK